MFFGDVMRGGRSLLTVSFTTHFEGTSLLEKWVDKLRGGKKKHTAVVEHTITPRIYIGCWAAQSHEKRGCYREAHTSLTRCSCEGVEAVTDAFTPVADPCVRALDFAVRGVCGVRFVRPC